MEGEEASVGGTPSNLQEIWSWWKGIGEPKLVVAPMVDASELAWRKLSRKHGAQLCFTPMFHSRLFCEDPKYRAEHFFNTIDPTDRPLIVQFCGNDPEIMAKAAEYVQDYCDAVDINLGCPQSIAKRGRYGAYLQDEWDLISRMVKTMRARIKVPVTCKIRVLENIERTRQYAKTIIDAGAFMLTVHGRRIDQKGRLTGLADWEHIKAVREVVPIPMLANGNIQYLPDVWRCIEATGVNGVMSAEGNLHNPAIFAGINPPCWEPALDYIEFAKSSPCPLSYSRGHLFKMFNHVLVLEENFDLRELLARGDTLDDFREMALKLKARYELLHGDETHDWKQKSNLPLPPWVCQPYVRPTPVPQVQKEPVQLDPTMSNKKRKKLLRNPNIKLDKVRTEFKLCIKCKNIAGAKCDHAFCKSCCRSKCFDEGLNCNGHRNFVKTYRLRDEAKDTEIPVSVS